MYHRRDLPRWLVLGSVPAYKFGKQDRAVSHPLHITVVAPASYLKMRCTQGIEPQLRRSGGRNRAAAYGFNQNRINPERYFALGGRTGDRQAPDLLAHLEMICSLLRRNAH
jgi:hypothetical protein